MPSWTELIPLPFCVDASSRFVFEFFPNNTYCVLYQVQNVVSPLLSAISQCWNPLQCAQGFYSSEMDTVVSSTSWTTFQTTSLWLQKVIVIKKTFHAPVCSFDVIAWVNLLSHLSVLHLSEAVFKPRLLVVCAASPQRLRLNGPDRGRRSARWPRGRRGEETLQGRSRSRNLGAEENKGEKKRSGDTLPSKQETYQEKFPLPSAPGGSLH